MLSLNSDQKTLIEPVAKRRATAAPAPTRNLAVDAYRGLVMLLMMGEVLHFGAIHHAQLDSLFWSILAYNQTHVEWAGFGLHDLIQPSFTFLVGVALPYSIQSRIRKGQSFGVMLGHTIWRSLLLIALGIFLRSLNATQTNFTFEDTLTQIGLGYTLVFLISFLKPQTQLITFGAILLAYWIAWALYPAPGPNFDYSAVGVPSDWHYNFSGFASHWNKNSNLGAAFDIWFLNLFSRPSRFLFNRGGYLTLSFIPTMGTMLLGLFAGQWLRQDPSELPLKRLSIWGLISIAASLVLHFIGVCPLVKRIWTPSWVLFSGGMCFLFLALFSWWIDIKGHRRFVLPLIVVGTNSIAAYLIAHLWEGFLITNLYTNFGHHPFQIFGVIYEPLLMGIAIMLIYWLALYWMFKNQVFLRL